LKIYRPRILFVEASEFWPVIINRAYLFGTKIVLLNGNIKREKLLFYKILSLISSNPFKKYELMVVRNPESFDSAKYLGVEESRLIVCINTKYKSVFDMKERGISEDIQKRFRDISKLVVFGSIHYEEEEEILATIAELIKTDSDVIILLAPRHLERVEYLIKKLNTQIFKNQNIASRFTDGQTDTRVIVLNTIGDLFYIYPFAKVAFVGGSLTDRGGHNIFEPAVWGVPVITGKYVRNYEDIVRFLLGFGLITVNNGKELFEVLIEILNNEEKRKNLTLMLKERVALIQEDLVNIEDMFLSRFVL
jgi:3-deoxy-D-manno-octulosonic-acid transferase